MTSTDQVQRCGAVVTEMWRAPIVGGYSKERHVVPCDLPIRQREDGSCTFAAGGVVACHSAADGEAHTNRQYEFYHPYQPGWEHFRYIPLEHAVIGERFPVLNVGHEAVPQQEVTG